MSGLDVIRNGNGSIARAARHVEGRAQETQQFNGTGESRAVERITQLEAINEKLEQEIAGLKRQEVELRSLAFTDDLTGLYNRRGFLTLAEQELKLAHRMGSALSLVYADLDDLKWINDTFGHEEGDAALRSTAQILMGTFRDSDIVARLGGDEFTVLVIETSHDSLEIIAGRLQERLADYNSDGTHPYELSISMGIAYFAPQSPLPLQELIAEADRTMLKYKRTGREAHAFS